MRPSVHLVDASPYIFRAFHALPTSLRDPRGRPVNAVLGFAGFVLRLLDEEGPSHAALCFDHSLTTSFRNDLYPAYKAQRQPPPEQLESQIGDCREIGEALGLAALVRPRFEADDLIASLVAATDSWAGRRCVVTSDKDLAQLVGADVELLDFARQARLGPREVVDKLGVRPHQVPDLLGLAGDSVDNIPGVRGVGPTTAARLLAAYGTLEAALDDLDGVAALPLRGARSLAGKLREQRETALLSKRLATVRRDAPVPGESAALAVAEPDLPRLEAVCHRLGLERLLERVRRSAAR
jgi:5'-3' exonuclease